MEEARAWHSGHLAGGGGSEEEVGRSRNPLSSSCPSTSCSCHLSCRGCRKSSAINGRIGRETYKAATGPSQVAATIASHSTPALVTSTALAPPPPFSKRHAAEAPPPGIIHADKGTK